MTSAHHEVPRAMRSAILLALSIAGCSGVSVEPHTERARDVAPPTPETVQVASTQAPDPDPGSTCGHALACCRAFATAMPNVSEASACEGVREALDATDPDARCRIMKDGWARALTYLEGEPPAACR